MELGNWSWLEVSKLIVGAATPFTIAIGGIFIHRITKKFEHLQWRSQKLIEKRLVIFDEMVPIFNRLLCYYTYVGAWRDCDPLQIVELKRTLNSKIYIYSPLFSDEFFRVALAFKICVSKLIKDGVLMPNLKPSSEDDNRAAPAIGKSNGPSILAMR